MNKIILVITMVTSLTIQATDSSQVPPTFELKHQPIKTITPKGLTEVKLTADDGASFDTFGSSIDIRGNRAAIGAPDVSDTRSGAVYIFEFDGKTWNQTTKITSNDAVAGARFGSSVSLGENQILIGAPNDQVEGGGSGSAYLFELTADGNDNNPNRSWSQKQRFGVGATTHDGHDYGHSLSFTNFLDIFSQLIVIGSPNLFGNTPGSVFVYESTNGEPFLPVDELTPPDGSANDSFGIVVTIEGVHIFVGAPRNNNNGIENNGAVYTFEFDGTNWVFNNKLSLGEGTSNNFFGSSIAVDNNKPVIGATGINSNTGAVYDAELNQNGTWTLGEGVTPNNTGPNALLGSAVSKSGNKVIAGSTGDDDNGNFSGSAFRLGLTPDRQWTQIDKITPKDAVANQFFGQALKLTPNHMMIAAPSDSSTNLFTGAVYAYIKDDVIFINGFESF